MATQLYLSSQNVVITDETSIILMISEVISIIVVLVGSRVPRDPTLVFWLGRHVCRGPAGPLHIIDTS